MSNQILLGAIALIFALASILYYQIGKNGELTALHEQSKVDLEAANSRVGIIADTLQKRIYLRENIIKDVIDERNDMEQKVSQAVAKLSTIKADQCFDRTLPNAAIDELFTIYSEMSKVSNPDGVPNYPLTSYDTSKVTGRWVATFAINTANALIQCGSQLNGINSYNKHIIEFNKEQAEQYK